MTNHKFNTTFRCYGVPLVVAATVAGLAFALHAQVESVAPASVETFWMSHGQVEGHLALDYSPAGAFSPDSTTLAVVSRDKIILTDLTGNGTSRALTVHIPDVTDLEIQSANYLDASHLFILASGLLKIKGKRSDEATPELAFQWDIPSDSLFGKIATIGAGGGYAAPVYFPEIRYLGLTKQNNFDLWNPVTGKGMSTTVPSLTNQANLFAFSPDGHWLLLAQIQTSSQPDPIVVELKTHQFVDNLAGHHGTVMSIVFSHDGKFVLTACEDGKVRIFSVPDWKLVQTFAGHNGPVHWAEFSPDGKWVASAGEDTTVWIWSVSDGKLAQTLSESRDPVLTVAFSPDGNYVAATTEKLVLFWRRATSVK